jgi:aminoglycoside phosphotransferase family enzyme/predicted kinase
MTPERSSRRAGVRETHAGTVFLVGDRAYKMKKPVDLGFLDFSTLKARHDVCVREVELNRRLSPDVYLGVADMTGPDGTVCEHLIVMRRMPEQRRLSALVESGAPVADELRAVAHRLASFHAGADRGPEISAAGERDALRNRWTDSFAQVTPFHGTVLDPDQVAETERLTLRFLAGRAPLFAARIADGRIVDGHGDLLTDDIFCLPDGPRILDCLEFDDQLRYVDQVDDAAFLAMDLEHRGAPEMASAFLCWYVEFAGDPVPPALLHHYLAYRAFVRAKVACLRHAQGDRDAASQARLFSEQAHRHLATGAVTLVLVGGLPGTGKSTLAGGLADRLGCTLLSSDRTRKELAGLAPDQSAPAGYRAGIYTPDQTERTYLELLGRAERLLTLGESVVLDASWTDKGQRAAAEHLAERTHTDLVALRCVAPAEVAAARMRNRRGPSDADAATAAAMAIHADAWPEATAIDTSDSPEATVQQALRLVRPQPALASWRMRRPSLPPD